MYEVLAPSSWPPRPAARPARPSVVAGNHSAPPPGPARIAGALRGRGPLPASRAEATDEDVVPAVVGGATVDQAAETRGPGGGSAARPRAASSRRTALGSVTAPRIRRGPPQRQTRTSNENTRRSSRAQGQRVGDRTSAWAASGAAGSGTMAARQRARGARSPW